MMLQKEGVGRNKRTLIGSRFERTVRGLLLYTAQISNDNDRAYRCDQGRRPRMSTRLHAGAW
jgi:hypothetical protein